MSEIDLNLKRILDDIENIRKDLAEETKRAGNLLLRQGVARVVGFAPPPPIGLFCGRRSELGILADYFGTSYGLRIAAIIGSSGMGKTALARKFLQDVNEGNQLGYAENQIMPEGIIYLSTRTTGISFERIFFDCARLLGQENSLRAVWDTKLGVREKAKRLLEQMQEGLYIIMLDNFEDLINPQGKIQDTDMQEFFYALCEAKSQSFLLITSNEPLALPAEIKEFYYPIDLNKGLSFDGGKELIRQLDMHNKLGLRNAPETVLNEIIEKTKGAPRALELLMGLLYRKPPIDAEEVLLRIPEGSYDVIIKGLSEKTYNELSDDEKHILESIAVFSRPVPETAVEFMLFPFFPEIKISETARNLERYHTITYEKLDQESNSIWLSLHPIDQDSIYKRISTDVSNAYNIISLERRAADYYEKLRLERPWFRLSQLDPQLLEFKHRMFAQDYNGALGVIDSVDYSIKNHHKYLASLLALGLGSRVIAMRRQLEGKLGDRDLEAQNLTSMGWVCRRMGRIEEANMFLRKAVSNSPPNSVSSIYSLSELGYFLTDNKNLHNEAETSLTNALKLSKQLGDLYLEAHCLLGLAFVAFQRGQNERSLSLAVDAQKLFHSLGKPYREIDCLVRIGMIYRKQLNYEDAIRVALDGLKVARQSNLQDWEGELNSGLGFHYRGLGKYDKAIEAHKDALRLFTGPTGMKREEAVQQSYLGNLYSDVGQLDVAEEAYNEAERIAKNIGLNRELSWIWGTKGTLLRKRGRYQEALYFQSKALNAVQNVHPDSSTIRHTDLAETWLVLKQYDQVKKHLNQALIISAQLLEIPVTTDTGFPQMYLQAPYYEDALPQEMQSPGDHQRRGYILACTYLYLGDIENALLVISHARKSDVIPHRHSTAALHGLILLRLGRMTEARSMLLDAIQYSKENIDKTNKLYDAYYNLGLALTGIGLISANEEQILSLNQAAEAYKSARNICSEKGVIDEALQLLDELQASTSAENLSILRPIRKILTQRKISS